MSKQKLLVIFTLFIVIEVIDGQQREAKIFDSKFWGGLERGLDRIVGDLEVTMDQLGSTLHRVLPNRRLSQELEHQIDQSLPSWLRVSPFLDTESINAIGGTIGGGVDDGLDVYYNGDTLGNPGASKVGSFPPSQLSDSELSDSESADSEPVGTESAVESVVDSFRPSRPSRPTFSHDMFSNLFSPFGISGSGSFMTSSKPWYRGPNVCVDRKETDESETADDGSNPGFMFFVGEVSTCTNSKNTYTCTTWSSGRGINKTVTKTYRCCHGFDREENDMCIKVNLRSIPEMMLDLETSDFALLINSSGMIKILQMDNITLFVPTNEAVQDYTTELDGVRENDLIHTQPEAARDDDGKFLYYRTNAIQSDFRSIVQGHVVQKLVYALDFVDEELLESNLNGTSLRINTYRGSPPIVTVNCARIDSANNRVTNGVIHTTDRVLLPVNKSIMQLLKSDPSFSVLVTLLNSEPAAPLLKLLNEPGQLTLFAPNNAAFRTLPPTTLKALEQGNLCLDAVLGNHVLPNTICSLAVRDKARTLNLLDEYIFLTRDDNDVLYVAESEILIRDWVATNGVIHVIDMPLIPSEAKPVMDVLKQQNLTRFIELLNLAEMQEEISQLSDVTIFAPSNKAIDNMDPLLLDDLMDNSDSLEELLRHHITSSALQASDISNNHIASTKSGHPLRINLYTTVPLLGNNLQFGNGLFKAPVKVTAGCSHVVQLNARACGGVIHVIDKVLGIPQDNVINQLRLPQFSVFDQILNETGIAATLKKNGTYTLLAPSNAVFDLLPPAELKLLMEDNEMKEKLAKRHILTEHLCCSGINANNFLFTDHKRTMDGSSLHVRRTHKGRIMVGPARITICGYPAVNGVMHMVNTLLIDVHSKGQGGSSENINRRKFSAPGLDLFFNF